MNKLDGTIVSMTPAEYAAGKAEGYTVVDVAPEPSIRGAVYVNLGAVNGEIKGLGKEEKLLLVCARAKEDIFFKTGCVITAIRIQSFLKEQHFFNDVKVKNNKLSLYKRF